VKPVKVSITVPNSREQIYGFLDRLDVVSHSRCPTEVVTAFEQRSRAEARSTPIDYLPDRPEVTG
jgi:hypothetical protein